MSSVQTLFGSFKLPMASSMDETTLRAIAEKTGGLYARADTAKALYKIYQKIDKLEKSEIETIRYVDYKEAFTPWAVFALICLAVEVVLRTMVFRRIP